MSESRQIMSLRHVEVFNAVYQTGSVSGAARALNVSQPSVSKVLRHAESRIGFTLFRVVKGRLVPTQEAHVLFQEARELYMRVESLQETAKNLRRGAAGSLRLAALPSLGLEIAPSAVAKFHEANPDIAFEIQTLHNGDILRSLYERNTDLALTHDAPHHPRLASMKVGSGELVLLFRKEDMPDPPETIPLDMLKGRDLIRLSGTGTVGTIFTNDIAGGDGKTASISVQTYYVAASLVKRGAGVAVVDEFTARASLSEEMDFRMLEQRPTFDIHCVHLEDRPLSGPAKKFISVLQKTIKNARQDTRNRA